MAKFTYNGDHVNFTHRGLVFRVNGVNKVGETDDEFAIRKFRHNTHFDEVLEVEKPPKTPPQMNKTELQAYALETYGAENLEGTKADMLVAIADLEAKAKETE